MGYCRIAQYNFITPMRTQTPTTHTSPIQTEIAMPLVSIWIDYTFKSCIVVELNQKLGSFIQSIG